MAASAVLAAAAAGCGSVTPASTTGLPGRAVPPAILTHQPLCQAVREITSLTVIRVDSLPQNDLKFSVPSRSAAVSPQASRSVAAAACTLRVWPRGLTMNCPADWGVDYRLTFATRGWRFPTVVVDATGCESVSGAGLNRYDAGPSFWATLATAIGRPHAASGFAGCRATGGLRCPKNATYTA